MRRRRWIVLGVVLVLLAAAVAVVWVVLSRDDDSPLARGLALAPESTMRFSWTDWAGVRAELDADLDASSSGSDVDDFLLDAFDRDLSSTTALVESAGTIQEALGFSPATIEWELFAQGPEGAVVIMGLPDSFDYDGLRSSLRDVGYGEPDDETGVWIGGVDLLEELDGPVTPEVAALQVDEDAGILYGSDNSSFLESRADEERGDVDDGVTDVAGTLDDALSAVLTTGDRACTDLAMSEASDSDRTRAAELLEEAGDVHPLAGFAIAARPGGDVRVAMAFENDDQARTDADSRSRLASGPAPGQGGTFPDRFTLGQVVAEGRVLTMELEPVDDAYVLSDLSHGPVLFATC